ncbi:MAG: tetratricopeptide repeat protein [Gammaproteobacteria bacterium]|nr:tetratricopeptide repeat protein [Gammaproteobacteria bacterium]
MSTATFKVVFCGRLIDGYSEDTVKSNLAKSFKLTPEQLAELFSGKEVVIKDGLSIETARQVQSAFVRQGVVTILRKVADGEASLGGGLEQLLSELRYKVMCALSTLYRACVKKFPAVEQRLESILPGELRDRLASGPSRPPPRRHAAGGGGSLPGKQLFRDLSTNLSRRFAGSGGESAGKRRFPGRPMEFLRRGLGRLPRFGLDLRRLKRVAALALLGAGIAVAVIYWPSDLQWTTIRAYLGSPAAQLELAFRHQNGDGVAQDDERAVHWFRAAAQRGDPVAQNELGIIYENGRGVQPDLALAAAWYGMAAVQGQAQAQNNLGVLYQLGRGVHRDDARAAHWYGQAAQQGHMMAQNNLGVMYQQGRGVTKDDAQAAYWYGQAATQGHAWAQTNLGYLYEHGKGVAKDPNLAALWYRKAAEQGHEVARQRLGKL